MRFAILITALLIFSPPETVPQKAELERAVTAYWAALMKQDKNSALQWVLAEARNNFILRREPLFRSWQLEKLEAKSENEAQVTVTLERMIGGVPGFYNTKVKEDWVFDGQTWKVRVEKVSAEAFREMYRRSGQKSQAPLPQKLEVYPKLVKIHFLNPSQRGLILVQNGLETPAQVVRIGYDENKFKLLDKPDEVQPGERGKITITYIGEEIEKDLKSQVTLVLKQGVQEQFFSIPVIYNYLSPGARGLLGLTQEQAQKLKRGDKVTPAIQIPQERTKEPPATDH